MQRKKVIRRLVDVARFGLAAVFVFYGGIKLFGGQYYYGDWVLDKKTVGGTSLVWAFYGYSPFYGRMTGLFELIPALLLLSRRTMPLGALALFGVSLNITLMDFAFDYPSVKYFALGYTVLLGLLVLSERERILDAFWRRPAAQAVNSAQKQPTPLVTHSRPDQSG
ncbi:hypothetical protein [Amycolatopsis suaedae]|uniref:DoxX family protein n=1 Tax=Amycolatopsis suaedae TaxID=2510978 RepID=A0A4Q7JBH3_9PSEU|nr:hypothetical protein [Amycolatopsis suaedae]RZQ64637.1 hypothetical protein EWH70_06990 [Amycolatopsis suaedae]